MKYQSVVFFSPKTSLLLLLKIETYRWRRKERTDTALFIDWESQKISTRTVRLSSKRWCCERYKQPLISSRYLPEDSRRPPKANSVLLLKRCFMNVKQPCGPENKQLTVHLYSKNRSETSQDTSQARWQSSTPKKQGEEGLKANLFFAATGWKTGSLLAMMHRY